MENQELALNALTVTYDDLDYKVKSLYKNQDNIPPAAFKEELAILLNSRRRIGMLREALLGKMASATSDDATDLQVKLNSIENKLGMLIRRMDLLDEYLFGRGTAEADLMEEKYNDAVDQITKEEDARFIKYFDDDDCDCEDEEEEEPVKCKCAECTCSEEEEEEEEENYFDNEDEK